MAKTTTVIETGIYSALSIQENCSVLQIQALKKALELLHMKKETPSEVTIHADSLAALKTVKSHLIRSNIVSRIRKIKISLYWVPGHRNVRRNHLADELAKGDIASFATLVGIITNTVYLEQCSTY